MRRTIILGSLMLLNLPFVTAQTKKSMTVDDLATWQRISEQTISDDGKWVACKMEPWEGDATLILYNAQGKEVNQFPTTKQFLFSASSDYLIVNQVTGKQVADSLKLVKTKKDKMPMDRVMLYSVTGKEELLDSIKSYKLSPTSDWLAYQQGRSDSSLHVRSLNGASNYSFKSVKSYQFAQEGDYLYFLSAGESKEDYNRLFTLKLDGSEPQLIKEGKGEFKQITFHPEGKQLAFLYSEEKKEVEKQASLWLSTNQGEAKEVVMPNHPSLPAEWVISPHGTLRFSKEGARLFFGTAPKPFEKDTTQLAENRPNVQVWNWDEPVQYTVQEFNKKKEAQRSYQAVYNISQDNVFQLANKELPNTVLGFETEANVALVSTSRPYSLSSMWESRTRHDYYVVSLESGERTLLSEADYTSYKLSPESNYAYGYAEADSCWYAWSLKDLKKHKLTDPRTFTAWNEENDVPAHPRAHGEVGWSKGDAQLYLYDRYDIWQLSPTNEVAPINLTRNGREKRESYRVIELDRKKASSSHASRVIDLKEKQLLLAFNEVTKGYAYYQTSLQKPAAPKFLLGGDYMLRTISKAQKSKEVIYSMETFEKFPDIYYSDLTFKSSLKLTEGDKQQAPFLWGSAELISWRSLDGELIEGVVYKPANFDPTKKYPMIVNFYEKNATTLHNFRMPEPNRSTVDYHYYNSHDYILFNPDIHYRDGYPGESCYNCVMPGVTELISKGYVDEARIGAQGHSWGGYQVAYLATRTNLFAAIESGAPVVNMFSAYGGIRWGSGLSRTYQYEHGQSRIAGTPWDAPLRFSSNSPLFTMDKVNTPILIMHNDKDGHVPWYQGIEYFVALKRLGKPCWMLNYVDEPHWPTLMPNKKDFQIRMAQFFDHYLKGSPMPQWMSEGVTAVEQPYELGY